MNEESFIVEEIINWSNIGFSRENGSYVVFEINKKDIDTFKTLRIISNELCIPEQNIFFMGLKDKDSTSKQFFFVKKELVSKHVVGKEIILNNNLKYKIIGYVARKPRRKDLVGNKFTLIIRGTDKKDYCTSANIMDKIAKYGLPSYYGYQRFGLKRTNSHLLGKYLISGRIDLFIREFLKGVYPNESDESIINRIYHRFDKMLYEYILVSTREIWRAVSKVNKMIRNILIDAYASYLYNMLLNRIIENHGWTGLDKEFPMPGCLDGIGFYKEILVYEGLDERVLKYMKCWYRKGLFKPLNIDLSYDGDVLKISFILESGIYATIIMRELFKDNLLFIRI